MQADSKENYIPLSTIYGKPNPDGTYTLTALDIKNLNDNLYAIAKKIQGGLTLSDLTVSTKATFNDMVTFTDLATGGSTVINGDNIVTGSISADKVSGGTLEGVVVISRDGGNSVELNGAVITVRDQFGGVTTIHPVPYGAYIQSHTGTLYLTGDLQVGLYDETNISGSAIRIASGGNMSINASGKTFIATNDAYSGDVDIGQASGTINLRGNVLVNGAPIGGAE